MTNNQRNPTFAERIDNFIGFFSPRWAFQRKAHRIALRGADAYENVPTWRNSAGWYPTDGSAEALNSPPEEKHVIWNGIQRSSTVF